MISLFIRMLLLLSFSVFCSAGSAQQGVYVTQGANGPVFSDKPQSGAKEVNLKPLSVVPAVPVPPAEKAVPGQQNARDAASGQGNRKAGGRDRSADSFYRNFAIVSPQDNGSIAGDASTFEVRLAVDPPLALAEGHAIVVRINGRLVERRFTAAEFMIPPEFWEGGYLPANQGMQLEASIVDDRGQIVARAAPVTFHTRQLAVSPGHYPGRPVYAPYPGVPPRQLPPQPQHQPSEPARAESRMGIKPEPANVPQLSSGSRDRPADRKSRDVRPYDADGSRTPASPGSGAR